jgi:hypothetical protein
MKLMIDENDFDNDGRPKGAFKGLINAFGSEAPPCLEIEPEISITSTPPNDPPKPDAVETVAPPKRDPAQGVASDTVAPPRRKKRRSKAEIEADDDAVCVAEIKAAVAEGREPDRANLPAPTRKRVGAKPQSWINPQQYVELTQKPCVVVDEPPPITADQGTVDPTPLAADPPTTDFSDFLEPEKDQRTEAELRFKIGSTLNQLAQLNRPAAQEIIKSWKTQYNTVQLPEIPAEALADTLAATEHALDNERPPETAQ